MEDLKVGDVVKFRNNAHPWTLIGGSYDDCYVVAKLFKTTRDNVCFPGWNVAIKNMDGKLVFCKGFITQLRRIGWASHLFAKVPAFQAKVLNIINGDKNGKTMAG